MTNAERADLNDVNHPKLRVGGRADASTTPFAYATVGSYSYPLLRASCSLFATGPSDARTYLVGDTDVEVLRSVFRWLETLCGDGKPTGYPMAGLAVDEILKHVNAIRKLGIPTAITCLQLSYASLDPNVFIGLWAKAQEDGLPEVTSSLSSIFPGYIRASGTSSVMTMCYHASPEIAKAEECIRGELRSRLRVAPARITLDGTSAMYACARDEEFTDPATHMVARRLWNASRTHHVTDDNSVLDKTMRWDMQCLFWKWDNERR